MKQRKNNASVVMNANAVRQNVTAANNVHAINSMTEFVKDCGFPQSFLFRCMVEVKRL